MLLPGFPGPVPVPAGAAEAEQNKTPSASRGGLAPASRGAASAPRKGENSPQNGSVRGNWRVAASRVGVGGSPTQDLRRGPTKGINRPVGAGCLVRGAGDASALRRAPRFTRSDLLTHRPVWYPQPLLQSPAEFGHRRPFS